METSVTLPRRAESLVETALADTRVVLVNGARQAGKSTLVNLVGAKHPGTELRTLDRPPTLEAAQDDPLDFVDHPGLLIIDEIQRAPQLFLPIKYQVDTDPRPGRYLLTGSSRVLGLKALPDSLPGRMETIELWPLSQGEIESFPDRFIDAAFASRAEAPASPADKSDVAHRVARGGFPAAVARSAPRRRMEFLRSYVDNLVERDIRELADIQHGVELQRLLQLVAARTGQLLAAENLASNLGISGRTVSRYLELCEEIFLIKRIPAWSNNLTKRVVSTPKVAFTDSGVAAMLLGQDEQRLRSDRGAFGSLLEGFVLMELAKQLTWSNEMARLFHYRTRDGIEVDAVIETFDGRVVGVEVKASSTVGSKDFAGLRHLAGVAGNRFVGGIVLYTGTESLHFGPTLRAIPITALWEWTPAAP